MVHLCAERFPWVLENPLCRWDQPGKDINYQFDWKKLRKKIWFLLLKLTCYSALPYIITLLVFCNGLPQIVLEVGKIQSDGRLLWTAVVGRDNWSQSKIVLHFIDDRSYKLYYRQHVFPEVIDHAKHWQPGIHELENNLFNSLKRWRTLSQINDCGDGLKFISIISDGFSFSLFFQVSFRIVVTLFLK